MFFNPSPFKSPQMKINQAFDIKPPLGIFKTGFLLRRVVTDLNLSSIPLTVYAGNNAISNSRWLLAYHRKGGKKASDTPTGIAALGKVAKFSKAYGD